MAAKNIDFELEQTVTMFRDFWPDFLVTGQNLRKPTAEFVLKFYNKFLDEIDDKLSELTENDTNYYEINDNDKEIQIYIHVSKIYKMLKYCTPFYLTDLYAPQPKISSWIKFSLHFLIFINNSLDDLCKVSHNVLKKMSDTKDLLNLKQQFLQIAAENAESIAHTEDTQAKLKKKLEDLKIRHAKMLIIKREKEKKYLEKKLILDNLQKEVDVLEGELRYSEDKEESLSKKIVPKEDFEALKKAEEYWKTEFAQASRVEYDINVDCNKKMIQNLEETANLLETLNFDALHVTQLEELRKKMKIYKTVRQEIEKKLHLLQQTRIKKKDYLKEQNQQKEEVHNMYSQWIAKNATDTERNEKIYQNKVAEYNSKFEESQYLATQILDKKTNIKRIQEEEQFLEEVSQKYLAKIYYGDVTVANVFKKTFLNLQNQVNLKKP